MSGAFMLRNLLKKGIIVGLCGGMLLSPRPVKAAAETSVSGLEALIQLLKEKKIVTKAEAARFSEKLRQTEQREKPRKVITIIPRGQMYMKQLSDTVAADIKDQVKDQVKYEIKDEVVREIKLGERTGPIPSWVQRIRWGGDIRLRHQEDLFDKANAYLQDPNNPGTLLNTTHNRMRERIRVRIAMKAEVNDQVEVGVRLATGNDKEPVSTNSTMGDYFNKHGFVLDQAYIRWALLPELTLIGGRMPNPFFSTDLVWDKDINFEGIAVQIKKPLLGVWRGFANLGYFPIQEVKLSYGDKYMVGGQVGIEYEPRPELLGKFGIAYYDYHNITGVPNTAGRPGYYDYTLPAFRQWGNDYYDINSFVGTAGTSVAYGLASDFKLLNLTMSFNVGLFDPVNISLLGDYVTNLGFDHDEILNRTGLSFDKETDGYMVALAVGYPKITQLGDWKVSVAYKYLEKDAVLDAFTDSDFHLGGTNAKGWILGTDIGLYDNVWTTIRWLSSDVITGVPYSVDTVQLDLNARF